MIHEHTLNGQADKQTITQAWAHGAVRQGSQARWYPVMCACACVCVCVCVACMHRNTEDNQAPTPTPTVREETLVRWRIAYQAMCSDAQALGIPRSAIPPLPPNASAESIRQARDHLEAMMASFLSAGL